jgi:GntR family transcriptional regulator/MocR family aminotransferase
MVKSRGTEIAIGDRRPGCTLTQWLYEELRFAILSGRLKRGVRIPATRSIAVQYGISRRTVVAAFEQLLDEGYITSRTGHGTTVSRTLPSDFLPYRRPETPSKQRVGADILSRLQPPIRPFNPISPAVTEFPISLWARLASRRLRQLSATLLSGGDPAGYAPLREAIADYVGTSRGVNTRPEHVIVTTGMHHGLDLIARSIFKPGDQVWVEDPGYSGTTEVIQNAGLVPIAVPVDERGLIVSLGKEKAPNAKAAFVTPAHQFPLGSTMSLDRRLELLQWARATRAILIEDDYDSEFRFQGRPIPALQSLDRNGLVLLLGSFNKVLFPGLRFGYIIAPDSLLEPILRLRFQMDRYPPGPQQAILCDFINGGHFERHLRKMRELYAERWRSLRVNADRYLARHLSLPTIEAGLNTPAYLRTRLTSHQAELAATKLGIQTLGLDRFVRQRQDIRGLLLGFAAFNDQQIADGAKLLARALDGRR